MADLQARETTRTLERLERGRHVVLRGRHHDERGHGVDDLVIGPNGVFIVVTRHWSGHRVRVDDQHLRRDGWRASHVVEEALAGAEAVRAAMGPELASFGVDVTPLVCIEGARVAHPVFRKPVLAGVRVVTPKQLPVVITNGPPRLSAEQVEHLARTAEASLRG